MTFPAERKPLALALIDECETYRTSTLDWTFFAPPMSIEPGERTGCYRTDRDQLLTDAAGNSKISAGDAAVALLDEL